jgi:hypothetical protein
MSRVVFHSPSSWVQWYVFGFHELPEIKRKEREKKKNGKRTVRKNEKRKKKKKMRGKGANVTWEAKMKFTRTSKKKSRASTKAVLIFFLEVVSAVSPFVRAPWWWGSGCPQAPQKRTLNPKGGNGKEGGKKKKKQATCGSGTQKKPSSRPASFSSRGE